MKYSKKIIVAAATTGIVGAASIGASAIAATSSNNSSYPPIVQKLASTFGLDPAKVNDVFKQQRQSNMQDRQATLKGTLDQAVKDGKITQVQEDKLITELNSLRAQNQAHQGQSHQNMRSALEQWAKDNGINNLDQILPHPGPGMHHHGNRSDDSGNENSDSSQD
jgi:hypothetical protein